MRAGPIFPSHERRERPFCAILYILRRVKEVAKLSVGRSSSWDAFQEGIPRTLNARRAVNGASRLGNKFALTILHVDSRHRENKTKYICNETEGASEIQAASILYFSEAGSEMVMIARRTSR